MGRTGSISPLLAEAQNKLLNKAAKFLVNGVDLNYKGNTMNNDELFVLDGTEALKNKVYFWFLSGPGDYIRDPAIYGPMYSILGRTLTPENAADIESSIRTSFTQNFGEEFTLVDVRIVPDVKNKRWVIGIDAFDIITRELFDIALGVDL
jgi:hypothetical protein